jgi:hypothetical protein
VTSNVVKLSPAMKPGFFATIGRIVNSLPLNSYVPAVAVNGSHISTF